MTIDGGGGICVRVWCIRLFVVAVSLGGGGEGIFEC